MNVILSTLIRSNQELLKKMSHEYKNEVTSYHSSTSKKTLSSFDELTLAEVGSWEWNLEKKLFKLSDKFSSFLGIGLKDVHSSLEDFLKFVHPDDHTELVELIQTEEVLFDVSSIFLRLITSSGEMRVQVMVKSVTDHKEELFKLIGIIQARVEDLRKSQTLKYRVEDIKLAPNLQDNTSTSIESLTAETKEDLIGLFLSDTIGIAIGNEKIIVESNDAFLHICGFGREELKAGKINCDELTPPDQLKKHKLAIDEAMATGRVAPFEWDFFHKDGSRVTTIVGAYSIQKNPFKFISFVLDITEQKKVEAALKHSQDRFQLALQKAPLMLYTQDLELRYTWFHHPDWLGDHPSIIGKRSEEVVSKESAQLLDEIKSRVIQTGKSERQEVRLEHALGVSYYDLTVEPIKDSSGTIIGLAGAAVDFTKVRVAEAALLKSEQQKQIRDTVIQTQEEERKRIAEALHNGLAQILYALQLNFDLLEENYSDKLKKEIKSLLDRAVEETRTISFELTPRILEELGLHEALDELCTLFSKGHLEIESKIKGLDQALDPIIEITVYRIVQELINNAVKHAQSSHIQVTVTNENKAILLEVKDNGNGFLHPPSSTDHSKSGLRSIRSRVNLLNGKLNIISELGSGTTVKVEVPIENAD